MELFYCKGIDSRYLTLIAENDCEEGHVLLEYSGKQKMGSSPSKCLEDCVVQDVKRAPEGACIFLACMLRQMRRLPGVRCLLERCCGIMNASQGHSASIVSWHNKAVG